MVATKEPREGALVYVSTYMYWRRSPKREQLPGKWGGVKPTRVVVRVLGI